MIKIAFFDVDGTLLKMGGKEPSKKTISTLKQLQKKGDIIMYGNREKLSCYSKF